PIVSFLMTKFCYRKIALCGSALVTVGLLGMPFIPYIPTMCFFFGVLTGFGNCCTYIPSHVLSGLYYDKYRSIATGVSTSGSGLGAAAIPVIVGLLIDTYSWKGSLIFVAALNLHLFIFAALLRYPSKPSAPSRNQISKPVIKHDDDNPMESQDERSMLVTPKKKRTDENLAEKSKSDRPKSCSSFASYQTIANYDNFGVDLREIDFIDKLSTASSADTISGPMKTSFSRGFSAESSAAEKPVKLRENRKIIQKRPSETLRYNVDSHRVSFLDVLYPRSVSGHSLFALGSRGSSVIYIENILLLEPHRSVSDMNRSISIASSMPLSSRHIYIFTNYRFNIYFLSNVMWNAGYAIIQSFAPEFLQDKGLTLMEAAWLSGTFGFASFLGGILGGVVGNVEKINRQVLYTVACVMMGAGAIGFPLFHDVMLYSLLLVVSGLSFGVILGLLIVVLTDLVGVQSLGNGLGYLMLSNGFGTFLGPPLASCLKELTGAFDTSLILAGCLCVVGGLIMFLMPCSWCSQGTRPKVEEWKMVVL
uniref:Major facilitator superfamily (MFS) profile domain-containing protein n=1 Tax=Biomphalaria glabrata TaxID=6526 RepID=A0A2C9M128_BIOGL